MGNISSIYARITSATFTTWEFISWKDDDDSSPKEGAPTTSQCQLEPYSSISMALVNDLILESIFSHLQLLDMKSCRLVCWKWKLISKKFVNKLSVCCIRNKRSAAMNLQSFNENFPDLFLIEFTNFRFEGAFSVNEMETFFNDGKIIKELTLPYDFTISDDEGMKLETYDITNWKGLDVKTLNIHSLESTTFLIPLSHIANIDNLKLVDCSVVFDRRIAPVKVDIWIRCFHNGGGLPVYFDEHDILDINECFDVSRLKEMDVYLRDLHPTTPKCRLDLTHCLRLESLSFDTGVIVGWHNKLILKKLEVTAVPLDISELPPSVRVLESNDDDKDTYLKCTSSAKYLKSLRVCGEPSILSTCPNLVHLCINSACFNLDYLPPSVREITIYNWCGFVGENVVQLEKLIFRTSTCFYWEYVDSVIDRLNPKVIVTEALCLKSWREGLHEIVRKGLDNGRIFVLKEELFEEYESPPVTKLEYNIYENDTKRSICKNEFYTWENSY